MVWPALSARRPAACTAGPSAIGSVNGMPSSIPSAPAASRCAPAGHRGCLSPIAPEVARDAVEVLVAAAGQIDHDQVILRLFRRDVAEPRERMRGFERRDDAFEARAELERFERLIVGRG